MSKILIVDDDPVIRKLLRKALLGYDIVEAANGVEALEKVYTENPDIIFLDYMMPLLDGLSVMHVITSSPRADKIHIALISANDMLPNGEVMQADAFFQKPFSVISVRKWADHIDGQAKEKVF